MKKVLVSLSVTLLFVLVFVSGSNAQDRILQGQVTVFDSIPVVNASVEVKSTKQIALTDSLGFYHVPCNETDKIKVSAHGFIDRSVKVNSGVNYVLVNLNLKVGDQYPEMAVGYGHVLEKDKLFAVTSAAGNHIDYSRFKTLEEAIVGRFSGVMVRNGEVIIRGNETFGASNAALIVIDGVSRGTSIKGIPPYNVSKIEILKGSSAAIYGIQGANGVVLISTKRGNE